MNIYPYSTPFTGWHPTNEQGVSTADLNRIEGNTKHVYEFETKAVINLNGRLFPIPLLDVLVQLFFIELPVGFKLVLESIDYYIETDTSYNHLVIGPEHLGDSWFNSNVDNSNLPNGNVFLNRTIAENNGDIPLGLNVAITLAGGAERHAGWSIRFAKVKL